MSAGKVPAELRLDPPRWPRLPRRAAIRAAVVTVLLLTATTTLYTGGQPGCDGGAAQAGSPGAGLPDAGSPVAASAGTESAGDSAAGAGSGDGRLAVPVGLVGVPVRPADPAAVAVLRLGDRVDLLAVPATTAGAPTIVAEAALVLAVVRYDGERQLGPALYLALSPAQARHAVALQPSVHFGVVVRA